MSREMQMTRRGFMTGAAGMAALGVAGLAGCAPTAKSDSEAPAGETMASTGEGANPSWLGAEPEVDESALVETVDCDVLVVGAGTSGMFAVAAAAENGANTVLIEQFAEGASSGLRDDIGMVGTQIQKDSGSELDVELLMRCFQHASGFFQNPRVANVWARESGETYDWFADLVTKAGYKPGIRQAKPSAEQQYTPYGIPSFDVCHYVLWSDNPSSWDNIGPENNHGCQVVLDYAAEQGADIRWETKLVKLIREGERVTGAFAENKDGVIRINAAKGVILCTGGYSMNPEMMEARQPDIVRVAPKISSSMPGATGDGIKAGLWVGAKLDPCVGCSCAPEKVLPLGVPYEDAATVELGMTNTGPLPYLRVNTEGRRFSNEDDFFDSESHILNYMRDPYCISIFDGNWAKYAEQFNVYHAYRFTPYDNGALQLMGTAEFTQEMIDGNVEACITAKADTLEELAEMLELPVDTFLEEVKRYNELCAAGQDTDFFKPAFRLTPIDTPPFYGERLLNDVYHTMDGLVIDEDMRVLDEDWKPIEGLYAAGDCSGSFCGATYLGTAAGMAAGRSVTFGRHAGRHAAQS